ncbi:MAG: hypothetical protein D6806_06320 [Deltaproteobacteria bacterium]|nr:MAG: hypothetical protein D6806_06320 [Deltaproteobacteria bacterium]
MTPLATKTINIIMQRHRLVIAVVVLISVVAGVFATRLDFDNTIESYFFPEDLELYNRFLKQFGSDEIIAIGFGGEPVFTEANLKLIAELSRELQKLPHVRRVLSLTTVKLAYGQEDAVVFEQLLPGNFTLKHLTAARKRALADPMIVGTLLAPDARATAIVVEIEHLVGQFDYKVELLGEIHKVLQRQREKTGKEFFLGGTAVLDEAIFRYTRTDQITFFPFIVLIIMVLMFFMFRQASMAVLPLLVAAVSALWTYGLMQLLGFKINVITTIIGPLLLAVAIADSMHILADYRQEVAAGVREKQTAITRTFVRVLGPCAMTSLTTVVGLSSLLLADLAPLRQFGLIASCGVVFAFLATVLLLPVLLSWLPLPTPRRTGSKNLVGDRLLAWLGMSTSRRARIVLALALLPLPLAVLGLTRLTVGTNSLDYLNEDDAIRRQIEWLDEHVGGTVSLEFIVEGGQPGAVKQPQLLARMERFQEFLKQQVGITGAYSVVDLIKTLNRAVQGGADSQLEIPGSPAAVAQELLLVESEDELRSFVSSDYSRARISARVAMAQSRRLASETPAIEKKLREIFAGSAQVETSGLIYLMHRMEHYILDSQIKSFALAFLLVFLCLLVMLRSWRLGLLALVPNLLPIVFTLALMPLLSIPLDVGTVMIAGVALGLVVDDTIHFFARFRRRLRDGGQVGPAIVTTMETAGRPIVYTSVVLCMGFLVLALASFRPVVHFGVLTSIVIALALVFDLLVTPAIISLLGRNLA